MLKRKLFLRWWIIMTLIVIGVIITWSLGGIHEIYSKDQTFLSCVIAAIFAYMSLWCGVKTWYMSNAVEGKQIHASTKEKVVRQEEIGWFTSDLCLTLGMIGTVIGFILMLSGFTGLDVANVTSIQTLIVKIAQGMGTALYTTLVGLVASSLLKIQYFNLSQAISIVAKAQEERSDDV